MSRVFDLTKLSLSFSTSSSDTGGYCLETCRTVSGCWGYVEPCYYCYAGGVGC